MVELMPSPAIVPCARRTSSEDDTWMTGEHHLRRPAARWAVLAALVAAIGAGAWWLTHRQSLRLDGLTRAQAEHAAVSGALYPPRACPLPQRVQCRPNHGHWRCVVSFSNGASVGGDPGNPYVRILSLLCS
jgi:hypothetical protein